MFQCGHLVTIIKPRDSFYNIVGRIVEITIDSVTLDLRYTRRTYKFNDVIPIVKGYPNECDLSK